MGTEKLASLPNEAHKAILLEATERFSPYREAEGLRHAFIQGAKWMLDRKEQVTDEMVERACAAHWKARIGEYPGALWTDESIRRPEWGQAYREDMRSALIGRIQYRTVSSSFSLTRLDSSSAVSLSA